MNIYANVLSNRSPQGNAYVEYDDETGDTYITVIGFNNKYTERYTVDGYKYTVGYRDGKKYVEVRYPDGKIEKLTNDDDKK